MKTIQELAQQAVDVQNACNIAGVAGLLQRTHAELTRILGSTDKANIHPITRAIIDKLHHLAMLDRESDLSYFMKVEDMAKGKVPPLEAMGDAVRS